MKDALAEKSKKPNVAELVSEYRRSRENEMTIGRLNDNDKIRYCKWTGQADDGKKHARNMPSGPVFPFEGASDVRYRLADRTVNELVALLVSSWQRSVIRVGGTEVSDAKTAALGSNLMRWITVNKLRNELEREAELAAQYAQHYGWTAFHITWDQQLGKRMQPITMDEVIAIAQQVAQQNPDSVVAEFPQLVADESTNDQAAAVLTSIVPDINLRDAARMVRELRENGETEIEQNYVVRNLPCVTALRPYDEVCFPPETVDLQQARVIYRRQLMTEVEVRSMAATDGWKQDFIDEVITTMGNSDSVTEPDMVIGNLLTGTSATRRDNMIEIVYAYSRQIGKDGVPCIYCTVISPLASGDVYGKHELLGYAHGEYPFVEYRREVCRRSVVESRGIPEICQTDQDEVKAQHDSIRDSTAFETLPPIKVSKRIGAINRIAPGVHLPVTRPDDYQFMEPPQRPPATAVALIDMVELNHARYFGLPHEKIPAPVTQTMQQLAVNKWLGVWKEVYQQVYALCLQYMAPEEIERVTGQPLPQNLTDIAGQFDFVVSFDVRELDNDFVTTKLESIAKFLIPLDTAGEIDRGALVRLLVESVSPDAARELVTNNISASERMYRQVQSDIGMMMLGNEAQYVENDPSAPTKLQYAQTVMQQNLKAQQAIQGDPIFKALMNNYVQNLQMSIQQQQNAQIGRIGVTSVDQQEVAGQEAQG